MFLNSLFKTTLVVKQTVVEEGESTKQILCQHFKAGICTKGDECEFSHDLNVEFNVINYFYFDFSIARSL